MLAKKALCSSWYQWRLYGETRFSDTGVVLEKASEENELSPSSSSSSVSGDHMGRKGSHLAGMRRDPLDINGG